MHKRIISATECNLLKKYLDGKERTPSEERILLTLESRTRDYLPNLREDFALIVEWRRQYLTRKVDRYVNSGGGSAHVIELLNEIRKEFSYKQIAKMIKEIREKYFESTAGSRFFDKRQEQRTRRYWVVRGYFSNRERRTVLGARSPLSPEEKIIVRSYYSSDAGS